MDRDDSSCDHQHDQSALGAGDVEIGPNLRAIVMEGLARISHSSHADGELKTNFES